MRVIRVFSLCAFVLTLVGLVGCSGEPAKGTINGTVTLDGQPVKEGLVTFTPSDGKSQTAAANIKDGKFTAQVPVHTMKVSFAVSRAAGKRKMYDTPDSPMVDVMEDVPLPEKYSTKSDLTVTVKGGVQEEQYALTTK